MNLITKQFNNVPFVFREDGWFNMTHAAKHFGKQAKHFLELPSTREYIEALKSVVGFSDLYSSKSGWHLNPDVGTWAHPKLAVFFARWLDVRFAVWCDAIPCGLSGGPQEGPWKTPGRPQEVRPPPGTGQPLRPRKIPGKSARGFYAPAG